MPSIPAATTLYPTPFAWITFTPQEPYTTTVKDFLANDIVHLFEGQRAPGSIAATDGPRSSFRDYVIYSEWSSLRRDDDDDNNANNVVHDGKPETFLLAFDCLELHATDLFQEVKGLVERLARRESEKTDGRRHVLPTEIMTLDFKILIGNCPVDKGDGEAEVVDIE